MASEDNGQLVKNVKTRRGGGGEVFWLRGGKVAKEIRPFEVEVEARPKTTKAEDEDAGQRGAVQAMYQGVHGGAKQAKSKDSGGTIRAGCKGWIWRKMFGAEKRARRWNTRGKEGEKSSWVKQLFGN